MSTPDDDPAAAANSDDAEDAGRVALDDLLATAADLRRLAAPWWIAGGWAIDLFVGRVTRRHADLEVGVWRDDQAALRSLWPGDAWHVAVDGAWRPWAGERIELPAFQLRVTGEATDRSVEFFLNDRTPDGTFVCRRDDRIRVPADRLVIATAFGVPALAPEVQLLYKAKYARPKDEHDLAAALPLLPEPRRRWLREALALLYPDHRWIGRLAAAGHD